MSRAAADGARIVDAEIGFFNVVSDSDSLADFPALAWTRKTDCIWEETETPPGSGVFDWAEMDADYNAAAAAGYGIVFVLKTGHAENVVNEECRLLIADAFQNVDSRLSSCPILTAYETPWKSFVRAVIRKYGFGVTPVAIQIETDSADRTLWAKHLETEGDAAAEEYLTVLRLAYEAKTAERWTGDIVLTGLTDVDRIALCQAQPTAEACDIPYAVRNHAFTARLMQSPQYFDAVDFHYLGYTYFMPYSIPMAVNWLIAEARKNDWNLFDKKLFMLEWVPSYAANLPDANALETVGHYFPYVDDFRTAAYIDDPVVANGAGVQQPTAVAPCFFFGDYTGVTEKIHAVSMRNVDAAMTPQQFRYTANYTGERDRGWRRHNLAGPVDLTEDPFLIGNGVYVQWIIIHRVGKPPVPFVGDFGVGALCHPLGAVSDAAAIQAALTLYINLDFAELPPPRGTLRDPKYRMWFEKEEAIAFVKDFCIAMSLGVERMIHVNFANFFPGVVASSDLSTKWHGMIRFFDHDLPDRTFIRKPSWWCLSLLADEILGFESCVGYNFDAGLIAYKFTFSDRDPVYIVWAVVSGVPNYRYPATPPTLEVKQVEIAFADVLGEDFATCRTFVTELDEDDVPIEPITLLATTEVFAVGLIPIIVKAFSIVPDEGLPIPGDTHYELLDEFDGGIEEFWNASALGSYTTHPREEPDTSPSLAFVAAPWDPLDTAMKVMVEVGDNPSRGDALVNKERAEIIWRPSPTVVHIGDEVYYSWTLLLPADYEYDTAAAGVGAFQIMGQWHDNGAGTGYQPPVAVHYNRAGAQSSLQFQYGLNEIGQTRQTFDVNISRGVRIDLKFHFLWANDASGYMECYVDGVLVHTFTGANVYPSQGANPNYLRLGLYRGRNQLQANTLYYGNFRASDQAP